MSNRSYSHLLRSYLETSDEKFLHQIARFGRQCVKEQVSQEEIIELHSSAMLALAEDKTFSRKQLITGGGECLSEVIMSYSLAFREQLIRREVDAQLRLFSQVVENTQDGIIITDLKGRIIQVNPAFSAVTGYSKEEAIGNNPNMLHSGRQDASFYRQMWQQLQSEGQWQSKVWNRRKNGEIYPELLSITTVLGTDDRPAYYIGIFSDISEQVNLEQQLQQAQKMEAIGTLVGGIAHDFNNMLAGISGNLFLLRKMTSDNEQLTRKFDDIESLNRRAADMIAQLMAFARKGVVQMKPMDLGQFTEQAVKLARVGIPENINFNLKIDAPGSFVIKGDATQLQQVLLNLLNNARDALKGVEQPRIDMHLFRYVPDNQFLENHVGVLNFPHVCISISDNGSGIEAGALKQIFDPFFTTKEVGKGTGLGLSMVYGMIQSHNGVIDVNSQPGCGTEINLYFALQHEPLDIVTPAPAQPTGKGGKTILLADDEDVVRHTAAEVLESFGYRVLQARDGLQAIEIFSRQHQEIDLLILDVVMPHYGGPVLANKLREISPNMPVLYATGYDRSHVLEQHAFTDKTSHVLTKPLDFHEMHRIIRSLLN
ncbi:PAS domain S-box protein [Mariprofundus ferrooxydans]|uniref:PAS domain S-box protein n=1 Tax=Mariprofundus ferrooxydans TaxID=314344 RepID=UPI0014305FF8|nr:PAS domain S-box protein [Mariprofundus ferrooxydans]